MKHLIASMLVMLSGAAFIAANSADAGKPHNFKQLGLAIINYQNSDPRGGLDVLQEYELHEYELLMLELELALMEMDREEWDAFEESLGGEEFFFNYEPMFWPIVP